MAHDKKISNLTSHKDYDPLLGPEEAASYLGFSPDYILRLHRRQEISSIKGSGSRCRVRFRLSELNNWIKRNEQPARP